MSVGAVRKGLGFNVSSNYTVKRHQQLPTSKQLPAVLSIAFYDNETDKAEPEAERTGEVAPEDCAEVVKIGPIVPKEADEKGHQRLHLRSLGTVIRRI